MQGQSATKAHNSPFDKLEKNIEFIDRAFLIFLRNNTVSSIFVHFILKRILS